MGGWIGRKEGRKAEKVVALLVLLGIKLIKPDYLGGCKKLQYGGRSRATFPAPSSTMKTRRDRTERGGTG